MCHASAAVGLSMSWRSWIWANSGERGESDAHHGQPDTSACPEESASSTLVSPGGAVNAPSSETEDAPFELNIIDESGEGFGFELNPATVAKPLAITSGVLFGFGAIAGIPMGIAMGRTAEDKNKVKPTMGGAMFATRAFLYGTLLCGAFGAVSMYATARYYNVWTWQEFGEVMRHVVPQKREGIESTMSPLLSSVREGAAEGLPGPTEKAKDWFGQSKMGIYIRNQIEEATNVDEDEGENK